MAIVRTNKRENPFSQIDRYVFESDDRLSWKAKGLMGYLLTRPDNWKVNHTDLVNRSKDGKSAVTSALQELKEAGYIHYFQERKEGGKFGDWIYDVYERPEYNPHNNTGNVDTTTISPNPENPHTEKPHTENRDYSNNNLNNNKLNNNKLNNKDLDLKNNLNKLNLPYQLKKHISNNLHLIKDDHGQGQFLIADIEKYFTKHQNITIKEHTKDDEFFFLSHAEFAESIIRMFQTIEKVDRSTYGLVKRFVDNKLSFKRDDYFDSLETEQAGNNDVSIEFDGLLNAVDRIHNKPIDHDKEASMEVWR